MCNEIKWHWLKSKDLIPKAVIYGIECPNVIFECIIPEKIGGMSVVVGKGAFSNINAPRIAKVIIPKRVSVSPYAFKNANVDTVVWPKGLETIPEGCFEGSAVSNIAFEDAGQIMSVGDRCFKDCKNLENFIWPTNAPVIPMECFRNSGLKVLENSETVKRVNRCAFENSALSYFPDFTNCRRLEKLAFYGTKINLEKVREEYKEIWSEEIITKAFLSSYDLIRAKNKEEEKCYA